LGGRGAHWYRRGHHRVYSELQFRRARGRGAPAACRARSASWRKGVNFHSFRHTVGDRLRKAGVAKDDRGFLLGHADVEMQNKVYGHDGPGLHRLQAIVEKIGYPGLRLPK
jgi:integrase